MSNQTEDINEKIAIMNRNQIEILELKYIITRMKNSKIHQWVSKVYWGRHEEERISELENNLKISKLK